MNTMRLLRRSLPLTLGALLVIACSDGIATAAATLLPQDKTAAGGRGSYSTLPGMITVVCEDAGRHFEGFFGEAPVTVEPFKFVGKAGQKRLTILGITIADQMRAIVNNSDLTPDSFPAGRHRQKLTGILQEIDGYLRLHISGVNLAGEQRSFVVNVEMSESIYRNLLTSTW